jgi:hypothetical protein
VETYSYAIGGYGCSFGDGIAASFPHGLNQCGLAISAQAFNANEYDRRTSRNGESQMRENRDRE